MLGNHVKFYTRLIIVLLVSTGILYYVTNNRSFSTKNNSPKKLLEKNQRNIKENIHRILQENKVKNIIEPEKKLSYNGSVYK